jgi:HAD superfamily hydrolase (TIGR01509 family)
MIKAIIFDCFGVLTTDGWLKFHDQFFELGSEAEREAVELNHQADAGLLGQPDFVQRVAHLAGVDEAVAHQIIDEQHAPNDQLFDYTRDQLKPHFKIGMLSNVTADYTPELFTPAQNALFDAKVFSYEVGVTKPHPAMYQMIATRLDALPEECIFIDDRTGFVAGARDVGMQAFQYRDFAQFRRELEMMIH